MSAADSTSAGKVYLVGAGPGAAGLFTLRGVEVLRAADVVLYDYLVNPALLRHAGPEAELICLGSHRRASVWPQPRINEKLVECARRGARVVRLKGGDPVVFGRAAEELDALRRHGIPFEIVPGITAALAAGGYAGIPVTHRDHASAVALVTGQERSGKAESALDFQALARFPGTLVVYMGVTTAPSWTAELVAAGMDPHTPAAIVRRCSLPDQRTIVCSLVDVPQRIEAHNLRPPAIVIIGPVVTLAPELSWFEQRPLFGTTVLVTRPVGQADDTVDGFEELGAEVLTQPAIEISPPENWAGVDDAVRSLGRFHWVVFSSANGVRYFLNRLLETGRDARALGDSKLAAIGPRTTEALADYHLKVDLQPESYRAEELAALLEQDAEGKRFLLPRASRGREVLAERIRAAGGQVRQEVVYRSTDVERPEPEVAERMARGDIEWVTVTSSAIARSLVKLFGEELRKCRLASISPVTSDELRRLGHEPAAEADEFTSAGLIEAVRAASYR